MGGLTVQIVIASDSPTYQTGFGTQARYLAEGLQARGYTVEAVSLPPRQSSPVTVSFPIHDKTDWAGVLDYGPEWTLITLTDDYKVLPALHYPPHTARWFRWVAYDGDVMPLSWVGLNALSTPVLTSPWSRTMIQSRLPDLNPAVIPHGLDVTFWHPPTPQEKREAQRVLFGGDVPFIVGYVGRGHPRKNLPTWFWMAGELAKRDDTIRFIMRMPPQDGAGQYDWMEFVDRFNLWGKIQWVPGVSQEVGVDPEILRQVYWAMDALMHPAMSEGFGLTPIEARLCGVPAVVGAYSAMADWASVDEQIPIAAWSWEGENIKQARVDAKAMVKRIQKWQTPGVHATVARNARKHVEVLTIDAMVDAWDALLQQDIPGGNHPPWLDIRRLQWGKAL
jgi:glycosyltransferase involved in cell wall biosynthesis